ncbi:hypothetical protein UlMin_002746 [Ulmus minor]
MILSWIYFSLTPEIMAQIIGHTMSNSAWNALEKVFSSSSRARIMQLRLQLQTTKKNSMSMIEYIMKLKNFSDSLAAIGEPVTEQDQIMNLLAGLGADYNAAVTSINARDNQLSIEAVHSLLLSFEHRLESQNSFDENGAISANFAQNKYTGGKNYVKNNQGYQRNSNPSAAAQGGTSNYNYNNRGRGRGGRNYQGGRGPANNTKPQCQLCGKFGHTVQHCYHRFDITFQVPSSTSNNSQNQP